MNLPSLIAALAAMIPLAACHASIGGGGPGSGHLVTQPRAVPAFTKIDLRAPVDLDVREGGPAGVSVTIDDDLQSALTTRVEGDTLIVELDSRSSQSCFGICIDTDEHAPPTITITMPALRAVSIEGAGDVKVAAAGEHPELDLSIKGSGDLRYAGNVDVVRCKVQGSGDVHLRGSGKRLEATVEGSGDLDARAFPIEGGAFDIAGSGDMSVDLHGGETSIRIRGSGDFRYSGEARITAMDVHGSGEVQRLD